MPEAMLADVHEAIAATRSSYDLYEWDTLPMRARVASIYRMLKLMDAEASGSAAEVLRERLKTSQPNPLAAGVLGSAVEKITTG